MTTRSISAHIRLQQWLEELFKRDEEGQDMIEYALVVALLCFAAAAGFRSVANQINQAFSNIGSKLTSYTA